MSETTPQNPGHGTGVESFSGTPNFYSTPDADGVYEAQVVGETPYPGTKSARPSDSSIPEAEIVDDSASNAHEGGASSGSGSGDTGYNGPTAAEFAAHTERVEKGLGATAWAAAAGAAYTAHRVNVGASHVGSRLDGLGNKVDGNTAAVDGTNARLDAEAAAAATRHSDTTSRHAAEAAKADTRHGETTGKLDDLKAEAQRSADAAEQAALHAKRSADLAEADAQRQAAQAAALAAARAAVPANPIAGGYRTLGSVQKTFHGREAKNAVTGLPELVDNYLALDDKKHVYDPSDAFGVGVNDRTTRQPQNVVRDSLLSKRRKESGEPQVSGWWTTLLRRNDAGDATIRRHRRMADGTATPQDYEDDRRKP